MGISTIAHIALMLAYLLRVINRLNCDAIAERINPVCSTNSASRA